MKQKLVLFDNEPIKSDRGALQIEKRVARLAWNDNGWVRPSGVSGKSISKSYESRYGYGHEEWLFDTSKIIGGYHYGFLEPINKFRSAYENRVFDIWLYTIDGRTKKRYWVGEIENVQVIDTAKQKTIVNYYKRRGWLKEMEDQILEVGGTKESIYFNVRFKIEDIRLSGSDQYYELPRNHPVFNQSRFVFMYFTDEFLIPGQKQLDFKFLPSRKGHGSVWGSSDEMISYTRKPKSVEVTNLHRPIQKLLLAKLRESFGYENVTPEHPVFLGGQRADIVCMDSDGKCIFYEIKTYNSVLSSIREAIGQLMEYAYWPNKMNAKELVIVTQKPPDENTVILYVKYIRKTFKLPLFYQWVDVNTNTISRKY